MIIGLDFGSNTLRAVRMLDDGRVDKRAEFIIQTARGLKQSKLISLEAKLALKNALNELIKMGFELKNALAVGTAVYRIAKNANELVKELESEYGFSLKVIDAKSEARLSQLALAYELKKLGINESFYFCDLGGASMELGFKKSFISLHCGIITMHESCMQGVQNKAFLKLANRSFKGGGGLKKGAFKKEKPYLNEIFKKSFKSLKFALRNDLKKAREFSKKAKFIVMNSGTPSVLNAYKKGIFYKDYEPVTGLNFFKSKEFIPLVLKLLKDKDRASFIGPNKKEYLLVGAFILKGLKKDALVVDSGICEGLCVQALSLLKLKKL